jgi:hypothetical protein
MNLSFQASVKAMQSAELSRDSSGAGLKNEAEMIVDV